MTKPGQPVVNLAYDPLGRLWQVWSTAGITQFVYDGDALVLEYDGSGNLLDRYVHGASAAADDPLIWYAGATASSAARRWLHADRLGSIVTVTNGSGGGATVNSYDEYGIPASANTGRFQYTGQAYIPEIGMYYYKARIYSPTLGRFMQTHPVGYDGGISRTPGGASSRARRR